MKVYLDNGATTKVDEKVVRKMLPYFSDKYGNASSLHSFGQQVKVELDGARKIIRKKLNADKIIFTSGGSESDNLAIKGIAYSNGKGHIITSKIEHHAVEESCKSLEKDGFEVTYLKVDNEGLIDPEDVKKAIREDTILVSIMAANNEIGTIEPIEEIGKICKEKNIIFHTDAVQAFTKVDIDMKKMNINLVSISGHKIHGPKGIGALAVCGDVEIKRLIDGGPQEFKLRAGTENTPGIIGLAEAVKLAKIGKMENLRDKLIKGIEEKIPNSKLNGSRKKRLVNNINFCFKSVEGESIGAHLDAKGIASSSGSACSSKSLKPSSVLKAIGLSDAEANGSIRLTLSRFTTEKEIDYVLDVLPGIIKFLRRISPYGL